MKPFIKAYEENEKKHLENENMMMWINGIYMMYAIAAVFGENSNYPDMPLQVLSAEHGNDVETTQAENMFDAYAVLFNERFDEK